MSDGDEGPRLVSVSEAVRLTGSSESTLRRLMAAKRIRPHRRRQGSRTVLRLDRRELLAVFGADDAPRAGPGSKAIADARDPRSTGGSSGGTGADTGGAAGVVAVLRDRVSAQEHELDGLRRELREAREKIEALRERIDALQEERAALLSGERPNALVRWVRGVREAAAELRRGPTNTKGG